MNGPEGTIIKGDGLLKDKRKKMILIVEVTKLQRLRQMVKEATLMDFWLSLKLVKCGRESKKVENHFFN